MANVFHLAIPAGDLDKSIGRSYDVLLGTSSAMIETDEGLESTSMGGGVTLRGSFLIDINKIEKN